MPNPRGIRCLFDNESHPLPLDHRHDTKQRLWWRLFEKICFVESTWATRKVHRLVGGGCQPLPVVCQGRPRGEAVSSFQVGKMIRGGRDVAGVTYVDELRIQRVLNGLATYFLAFLFGYVGNLTRYTP